ncbi:hypothetical protein GF376_00125 [Candidatus Peregrinibacteria bacterium]|nr:hypothetical protein [Candidatus Peregrinibacteria bacterium]
MSKIEKFNNESHELSDKQVAAIKMAKELSYELESRYKDDILEWYRQGETQSDIANLLLPQINERIARQAVLEVIKRSIDLEERNNLAKVHIIQVGIRAAINKTGVHALSQEERHEISSRAGKKRAENMTREFHVAAGKASLNKKAGIHGESAEIKKSRAKELYNSGVGIGGSTSDDYRAYGKKAQSLGVGIHAMTTEERSALSKKTYESGKGLAAQTKEDLRAIGDKVRDMKKGVHGLTSEELSQAGKKSKEQGLGIHGRSKEKMTEDAIKAVIARGNVPWEGFIFDPETGLDEAEYCILLMSPDSKFQRISRGKLRLDLEGIAEELNKKFHGGKKVRTKSSLNNFRYQNAKKK